jgi:hypothetical protein
MQMAPLPAPLNPHIWAVVGQSAQLTMVINGSTDVTAQAEWQVTSDTFATVTSTGMLTALRAGHVPLTVTYQGRRVFTVVTIFAAPPTAVESFSRVIAPRERSTYLVTVGAGGRDVVFVLSSSGSGSTLPMPGMMFGTATGDACLPPYTWGYSWAGATFGSGGSAAGQAAGYQVSPGRYCVTILDSAAITAADGLPASLTAPLTPLSGPVNYTLRIGASGVGSSVISGQ